MIATQTHPEPGTAVLAPCDLIQVAQRDPEHELTSIPVLPISIPVLPTSTPALPTAGRYGLPVLTINIPNVSEKGATERKIS